MLDKLRESTGMSGHDKKNRDGTPIFRGRNTSTTSTASKSPIKTPPRAALAQSRSAADKDESKAAKNGSPKSQVNEATPENHQVDGNAVLETSKKENSPEIASRDLKIAHLEKENTLMQEEFAQELNHLSHKLTSETEKANFWEKKHSSLNQMFLKTDTELRVLQHDFEVREKQLEERDKDIKTRISSLMIDRDAFREGYNATQRDLKEKEGEVAALRHQVRDLKMFVSTNTRTESQMTDEAFGDMMQRLGNGLQNWVISNFRKPKIDLSKLGPDPQAKLSLILPVYVNLDVAKFHLIQSIVSATLVTGVFNLYFAGLPVDKCAALVDMEHSLGALASVASMNQWRSTTLAIIKKDGLDKLQLETEGLIETVVQRITSVLCSVMDIPNPEVFVQSLRHIVIDAVELSRLLRIQKARFRVNVPLTSKDSPIYFDSQSMDDVGGEDDLGLDTRKIRCVTFPGLVKEGDENGEQVHLTNVVAKARVLCEPA